MTRFLLFGLLLAATPATAQVYRWVDGKGTVHYSNAKPVPGNPFTTTVTVIGGQINKIERVRKF